MLAGGSDGAYRALLAGGARFVRRLEVWKDGVRVDTYGDVPNEHGNAGVPITGGQLSANLASRVTRKLRLSVPQSLFPAASGDLLDPLAAELRLWCGWRAGAGPAYLWQVFTGPVTAVSKEAGRATFTLDATDRVEQIIEDKFLTPVQSGAGALITTRIKDLISDSRPGAVFGVFDETYATVPALTWEDDRAQALDDLAASVNAYWYQLPDGSYTLRTIPWSRTALGPAVATFAQGIDLTSATITRSRTGVYTICQVSGEPTNGGATFFGSASDDDPTSPTYYNGPLGRRVLKVQQDTLGSNAQAGSLARGRLRRARVSATQLTTRTPFDPSLELGDTATIVTEDGTFTQAIISFTANLDGAAETTTQWRAPGGSEDE